MTLLAGTLFANRFEIDSTAGSGGMGTVYRARDRYTGDWVALKLLHATGGSDESERFAREAQLLSELRHPGIVSYLAHGQTADGLRFLAMEWLDGEDLGRRLSRGPLSLRDSIRLIERVAKALWVFHQRGIVHRDIKPTNLFLPEGDVGRAKILDFGIARRLVSTQPVTRTGVVIGTPEYMAPEQARGARDITPAADVFSLGCVLYECLTGRPPFVADHVAAVLVRILFEEPIAVEERRPGVPKFVLDLLKQMLRKEPAERLADGEALQTALSALGDLPDVAPTEASDSSTSARSSFAESEQDLFSVVLAAPPEEDGLTPPLGRSERALEDPAQRALLSELQALGVSADFLASAALVVTVPSMGSATDQATRAAHAALLIKKRWPLAVVSIATGRGAIQGRIAVGEVVEQAARPLRRASSPSGDLPTTGVLMDTLTAKLLEGRFAQTPRPGGTLLLGEEPDVDASRPLLGKPTACVGRDTELAMIEAQLSACVDDSEARAILVTAPPGMGKSRLRHELLRRAALRDQAVTVIQGRGDLMTAGAPYGILAQALRAFCGVSASSPPDMQRAPLASHIGRFLSTTERTRVITFLGELCGVPFSDDESGFLSSARSDPRSMHDQIQRAFVEWLSAECERALVLIVLDDLQWGDTLSVGLIDAALHELRALPLCVFALARPEVREVFPKLWPGHRLQEILLKGLSRKACERLALQVLGKQVPPEVVARIVEQSTGNALFLEELIRAVGEGEKDAQPETVMAMLQARIGRFEAGPRRAVRAASVLGQTFWGGGVAALLGLAEDAPQVHAWLGALVEAEVIEPRTDSRFSREKEYGFRHALVREAAYSLLTESDLTTGHGLAARYLERMGEPEPLVLAEHYRRGGELERTVPLYLRAAGEANRMLALPEARLLYSQAKAVLDGLRDSPENIRRKIDALVKYIQLSAHLANADDTLIRLDEARSLLTTLPEGGAADIEDQRRGAWINLAAGRAHISRGQAREAMSYFKLVLPIAEALGDDELLPLPAQSIGSALAMQGHLGKARPLLARALPLLGRLGSDYEWLRTAGAYAVCLMGSGRYREAVTLQDQILARAVESKQSSGMTIAHTIRGSAWLVCADFTGLLESARYAHEYAQKSGEHLFIYAGLALMGWAHSSLGHSEEARSYRDQSRELERQFGMLATSDWFAAADVEIAMRAGDFHGAITLAERLVPGFEEHDLALALGVAEQAWGLSLGRRDLSQHAEADAHLSTGLHVFESAEQTLKAAQLRLEWADLCRRRGSADQAAALREQAVAQFEASGCAYVIEGIERASSFGWPSG